MRAWYRFPFTSNRAHISPGTATLLGKTCDAIISAISAPSMQSNVTDSRIAVKACTYLIDD
jgi:hypothetical protein